MSTTEPLLRVEDLRVEFPSEDGIVHAVDGITYQAFKGRTLFDPIGESIDFVDNQGAAQGDLALHPSWRSFADFSNAVGVVRVRIDVAVCRD